MSMQIPFVAGLIYKDVNEKREFLIQTRWKPEKDPIYSGTIEFPAGVLDIEYETVFDAVAREIREETGLTLNSFIEKDCTTIMTSNGDDEILGFRPFCCIQQLKSGKPWVGFIFLCEVNDGPFIPQSEEVRDIRWMPEHELKKLFNSEKSAFFGLELPAWEYYFRER